MPLKPLLAVSALLAATAGWAQSAPDAEPTAEQLACQLEPSCANAAPVEPEAAAEPEAPAADATGPQPRKPKSRGFTIERKPAQQAAAPARPKLTPAKPGPSAGKSRILAKPALPRVDLRVSFVTGSADLTDAGKRRATTFAEALKSPLLAGARFAISGHTDAVGSRESNLELSRRRAQAVVDHLVALGADPARFEVQGYGPDRPLPGLSPKAPENRRVEVDRLR